MSTIDDSTAVALGLTTGVVLILLYVWVALALAALFRKSGEQAWKGWVPILNQIVVLQLGGLSGWLALLLLVPGVGALAFAVCVLIACHSLNKAFGYGGGMTVLAAFLFPVWASVLGFGPARWIGRGASGPRRSTAIDPTGPASAEIDVASPGVAAESRVLPPPPTMPAAHAAAVAAASAPAPADAAPAPAVASPAAATAPAAPATASVAAADAAPSPIPAPAYAADEAREEEAAAADVPAVDDVEWSAPPAASLELTDEVTGAAPGAPTPISAIPRSAVTAGADVPLFAPPAADEAADTAPADAPSVDATPVAATPADAIFAPPATAGGWTPSRSPAPDPEASDEASAEVSAIAGAPDAGGPRSARTSVSALYTRAEIPEDPLDETIVARRRRSRWTLSPVGGQPVPLTSEVVIIGRRPAPDAAYPAAQLVAVHDGTVSKTHARMVLRDDRWFITDLGSTNGVLFPTVLGTDVEATPGEETEAGERFLLGDAEMRLARVDE